MKYLISGGLGFIGSELSRQLLKQTDCEMVYCVDDNSKGYGTANIADFMTDERFEWINIDLSKPTEDDLWLLKEVVEDVDFVIGCASKIGGIGYFNKIPATILRDNNLITTTLLDLIVDLPKEKRPTYVALSSSMVFESATEFPSKESDVDTIKVPITSYGFSKMSHEWYCKAYAQQYGLDYIIVRPFNAIGPEKPDPNFVGFSHVIPDLICKIKAGQGTEDNPLEILGDGTQVRHYTDVREIADGIIQLMNHHFNHSGDFALVGRSFNISIGKGHTVKEIAEIIWINMSRGLTIKPLYIKNVAGFSHDVKFRSPDISKMKNFLGWEAKNTFEMIAPDVIQSVLKLIEPKKEIWRFCGTNMEEGRELRFRQGITQIPGLPPRF